MHQHPSDILPSHPNSVFMVSSMTDAYWNYIYCLLDLHHITLDAGVVLIVTLPGSMWKCEMWTPTSDRNSCLVDSFHWRYNDHDGVSNHQPHDCLLNCWFGRRLKKTSKLRVTCLCAGNSPGPMNSPHKEPVTRKMFPFDDVIMPNYSLVCLLVLFWYRMPCRHKSHDQI